MQTSSTPENSPSQSLSLGICSQIRQSFLSLDLPESNIATDSFFKEVVNRLPTRFSVAELSKTIAELLDDDAAIDLLEPRPLTKEQLAQFNLAQQQLELIRFSPQYDQIKKELEEISNALVNSRVIKKMIIGNHISSVMESLPEEVQKALQEEKITAVRSIDLKEYYATAQELASFIHETIRGERPISISELFSDKQHPLVTPIDTRMGQIDSTNAFIIKINYFGFPEVVLETPLGEISCYKGSLGSEIEKALPALTDAMSLIEIPAEEVPNQPFKTQNDRFFLVCHTPDRQMLSLDYRFKQISEYLDNDTAKAIWTECLPSERAMARDDRKLSKVQTEYLKEIRDLVAGITEEAAIIKHAHPLSLEEIKEILKFDPESGPHPDTEAIAKLRANGIESLKALKQLDISADYGLFPLLVASYGKDAVPYILSNKYVESSEAAKLLLTLHGEEGAGWIREALNSPDGEFHKPAFALLSEMYLLSDQDVLSNFRTLDSSERSKLIRSWENNKTEISNKPDLVAGALELMIADGDLNNAYYLLGAIRNFGAIAAERIVPLAIEFGKLREDNQWGLDVFGQFGKDARDAIPLLRDKSVNGNYWEQYYARCSLAAIEKDLSAVAANN